jgi:hypothetical protein
MPFAKTRAILQRGTRAAQPAAASVQQGALYFVTDESVTEQSTGAAWVTFTDVPAGTGDVVGPASAVDDRIATFDGVSGKLIQDGGQTVAQVIAAAVAGAGDVVGPASAVDDRIATFDGVTGKLIQDGGRTIATLAKLDVDNTLAGKQTLTSAFPQINLEASDNVPLIQFVELSAGVDEKKWQLFVAGERMYLQVSNDAGTVALGYPWQTDRSGNLIFGASISTPAVTNNTGLAHGTFTPSAAVIANCSVLVPADAQYLRVGNVVTVSGSIALVAAAMIGAVASFTLSLPINSAFTAGTSQLAGTVSNVWGDCGAAFAGAGNTAECWYTIGAVGSVTVFYTYTYRVV